MRRGLIGIVWMLLTMSCALGCKNGSTPMTLTVDSISPTAGYAGQNVILAATLSGSSGPFSYTWSLGGAWGSLDDPNIANPTLSINPGASGTQTVTLQVSDGVDIGLGMFNFDVNALPQVTAVNFDHLSAGLPLGMATFEATTSGTPDSLAWDFGDGADPGTSGDTTPEVVLQNPGIYSGTVTPTTAGVAGTIFGFEYTVAEPVVPNWISMDAGPADYMKDRKVALIEHGGRLVAATTGPDGLRLYRATTTVPSTTADWTSHLIDPEGEAPSAMVSRANRLIVYYTGPDSETAHRIAVATVTEPGSSSDWDVHVLLEGGAGGRPAHALYVRENGDLAALTYTDFSVTSDSLPNDTGDWTSHFVGELDGFSIIPSTIGTGIIEERDFAVYVASAGPSYRVWVGASTVADPDESSDWNLDKINDRPAPNQQPLITGWDSLPLVLQMFRDSRPGNLLAVVQSSTLAPAAASDWTFTEVFDMGFTSSGGSGAVVASRLVWAAQDSANGILRLVRQVRIDPAAAASWQQIDVDLQDNPGRSVAVLEFEGRIVLASVTTESNQLRINISDGLY